MSANTVEMKTNTTTKKKKKTSQDHENKNKNSNNNNMNMTHSGNRINNYEYYLLYSYDKIESKKLFN